MTETLDPMDQTKIDHQKLAQQLLAQAKAEGVELVGPNGLLNQLTANRHGAKRRKLPEWEADEDRAHRNRTGTDPGSTGH